MNANKSKFVNENSVFKELIKSIYSFQELKEESSISTDESKHFFSLIVNW